MKKIGLVFALVALLFLYCDIASAKKCVKWETEVYACGETWAPADGDPLSKGIWYPVTIWCERQVCVEWSAKSDQPSEKMFASDDDCNCTCAECGWKCGTGHATSCSSYQKPKAKSDITNDILALNTPPQVGANCIEKDLQCTLHGTPCCAPYTCQGKFPNTYCQ